MDFWTDAHQEQTRVRGQMGVKHNLVAAAVVTALQTLISAPVKLLTAHRGQGQASCANQTHEFST